MYLTCHARSLSVDQGSDCRVAAQPVQAAAALGADAVTNGASAVLAIEPSGAGAILAAARAGARAPSAMSGAVRCWLPLLMYWLINSRMRESREPADDPPITTATRCRPLRLTEVTRLKPEA